MIKKATNMRSEFVDYSLLILAIIGIILSIELTVFYFMVNLLPDGISICLTNNYITCEALAKSSYSAFFGIPFSIFNLIYFLVILAYSLALFFKMPLIKKCENPKVYIFTFATFALLISTPFFLFSSLQSKSFCLLCFTSYLSNLCLFGLSKKGISIKNHYKNLYEYVCELISNRPFFKAGLLILAMIPVVLFLIDSTGLLKPRPITEPPAQQMTVQQYYGINGKKLKVGNIGNVLGSKNPKVIVNEYSDYQCPYCQLSNQLTQQLVQDIPYVQVVHNDLPLDKTCNPAMNSTIHENSCISSLYGRAAKKQGKFWDMNILMFENQQNLSEENILKLAKSLNLNIDKLKKDAHDPNALEQLKTDSLKAAALKITATPTLFIEKQRYNGLIPYAKLKEEVIKNKKP